MTNAKAHLWVLWICNIQTTQQYMRQKGTRHVISQYDMAVCHSLSNLLFLVCPASLSPPERQHYSYSSPKSHVNVNRWVTLNKKPKQHCWTHSLSGFTSWSSLPLRRDTCPDSLLFTVIHCFVCKISPGSLYPHMYVQTAWSMTVTAGTLFWSRSKRPSSLIIVWLTVSKTCIL